jgi:Holliday junction DNA helicase RuvA
MFAKLRGTVDERGADWLVVDVGGVGYLVSCSAQTLDQIPAAGEAISLKIETHVREDRIQLFGFASGLEREWFRLLTTVQGVGTRVALALLSAAAPDQLASAIAAQDKALLTRADGVGPKLAARIVSELKDKAGLISTGLGSDLTGSARTGAEKMGSNGDDGGSSSANEDAISALVNLGYGRAEAFSAVAVAARELGSEPGVDELVPAALQELAR